MQVQSRHSTSCVHIHQPHTALCTNPHPLCTNTHTRSVQTIPVMGGSLGTSGPTVVAVAVCAALGAGTYGAHHTGRGCQRHTNPPLFLLLEQAQHVQFDGGHLDRNLLLWELLCGLLLQLLGLHGGLLGGGLLGGGLLRGGLLGRCLLGGWSMNECVCVCGLHGI